VTTVVWLIVTFITAPEPQDVLVKFYRAVRPHVDGWKPIARLTPDIVPTRDLGRNLLSWVLGCAMVYLALFGSGYMFLLSYWKGLLFLILSVLCAAALYSNLIRGGWEESESERLARSEAVAPS
jgi:SSS family solute:Na+ symporter